MRSIFMTDKENRIRAWRRQSPQWIPIGSGLPFLDWATFGYDENELENICIKHEILFPGYQKGAIKRNHDMIFTNFPDLVAAKPYTDGWGCNWETPFTGMVGAIKVHPFENWDNFENFKSPDIENNDGMRPIDWTALKECSEISKKYDGFFMCGLPHGHTFLRAQDLRGYTNFIMDMVDEDPNIIELLDVITNFNVELVKRFISLSPDCISMPEDLGMQNSPMISPDQFKEYIAPRYNKFTKPIKDAGIIVHEHSDGFIMPLMEDIIRTGGDVINLQDLVNGVDNIATQLKGRISVDLDIDRQNITVNGSTKDIDDHIRECVMKIGSKEGGLSMVYQPWPPTPSENMDAVFGAMEKYCVLEYPW